jgi:RsiW-degrading membrane proteinase PrsW (M82 family)
MDLLTLIVVACIICFAFWANNRYAPVPLRMIINIALVIIVFLGALSLIGVLPHLSTIHIGR